MTGYGKGVATVGALKLTLELKAVNGRFLEINSRLGKLFACGEDTLKKLIAERVKRGNVEVSYSFEDDPNREPELRLNLKAAESFYRAGAAIAERLNLPNDVTVSRLLTQPEVLKTAAADAEEAKLIALVAAAAAAALKNLDGMREREGASLKAELQRIGKLLSGLRDKIEALEPECRANQREKLRARIEEALKGTGVTADEGRFLNEVAYLADKADVTEETARIKSHLKQYFSILDEAGAGRKLEFLAQELGREINTIGSKSQDLRITNLSLEFKNELEKIKEQIRNVE
jgi:uncharacterized protein (TIGR00255 family)